MMKINVERLRPLRLTPVLLAAASFLLSFSPVAFAQETGCPGASVPMDVSSGLRPFARMKIKGREGNFLIDTGAVDNHIDTAQFGFQAGSTVAIPGTVLPTVDDAKFITQDLGHHQNFAPPGGYAGAIGTSILSSRVVAFHYNGDKPYLVLAKQQCPLDYFEKAGYAAISQKGIYGPNNPTGTPVIYIQVGSVRAPIWIDSGMASSTTRHMNIAINETLFQQLQSAGVVMKENGSATMTDCKGVQHDEKIWQVQVAPFSFTNENGQMLFQYGPPTFQVRGKTQCGLIGDHTEPLGTIGALMLARWGTVIFDGPNERVWVTKNRSPAAAQIAYQSVSMAQGDDGGISTVTRMSAEEAKAESLKSCGGPNKNCKIVASIGQNQFACLGLAANAEKKLVIAAGNSYMAARGAVFSTCTQSGATDCRVIGSVCND